MDLEKRKAEYKAKKIEADKNKANTLKNRVFMLNLQAELISGVASLMRASLADKPPKFKADHTLYKASKEPLDTILAEVIETLSKDLVGGFGLRAFIQTDQFNIKIKCSSFYPVESGCVYLDDYVYVYARNDANLPAYELKFITLADCKAAMKRRLEITEKIAVLEKERSALKQEFTLIGQ